MLLGTYQMLPYKSAYDMEHNILCRYDELYPADTKAYMACFPVDDVKSGTAGSICTRYDFAQVFLLLKTDSAVRVNRYRFLQLMAEGGNGQDMEDAADDTADDAHSMFLVDPHSLYDGRTELVSQIFIMPCVNIGKKDFRFSFLGGGFSYLSEKNPSDTKFMETKLHQCAEKFGKKAKPDILTFLDDTPEEYRKKLKDSYTAKTNFEYLLLPFLLHWILTGSQADRTYFHCCLDTSSELLAMQKKMLAGCSDKEMEAAYENVCEHIITDPNVLAVLDGGKIPERNDLCPCGSGKKWKKCHGKLI